MATDAALDPLNMKCKTNYIKEIKVIVPHITLSKGLAMHAVCLYQVIS